MKAVPDVALRALPPTHAVLATDAAQALARSRSHEAVRALVREVLDGLRAELASRALAGTRDELIAIAASRLADAAKQRAKPHLRRVINATGVVLHTNLGRAPLGDAVLAEVYEACRGYATLEYDLDAGRRGHRDAHVAPIAAELLGARDVAVVNNCAAAVLVTLTALAAGREVLVSRGELVEIGGGFRVPEIIASCGARLVEVGTTNRTRVADYERAITPATAAILRVHPSNFAVVGFTESAPARELSALAKRHDLPLLEDLGSGAMVDTTPFGVGAERTVRQSLAEGVDLVMVSGDKLLGGPQAGIVAGDASLVAKVRQHPLMRALRPGRLVLAALEATLRAYADGRAARDVPVVAMLAEPEARVKARAETLAEALRTLRPGAPSASVRVEAVTGRVGGGTLPLASVSSWAVRLGGISATTLARHLRAADAPVVARIEDDVVWLDARTLRDDEVQTAARSAAWALGEAEAETA